MKLFDIIVLTAANEAQATGYREQIAWRRTVGLLPEKTECIVVPDPGGCRVGSLGSTFFVLLELARRLLNKNTTADFATLFRGHRILICHSGGDSRRTPAYTAQGKVFTPVPVGSETGAPLALFDLILRTLAQLPAPDDGHVLVTSGDVLLTFDHASVDFSSPGITGVAYYGSQERGSRHGVYVPEGFKGVSARTESYQVRDFLQKPDNDLMQAAGATDSYGHVAIDTGLVSFGPDVIERFMRVCGVGLKRGQCHVKEGLLGDVINGDAPPLDLYKELLMALSPSMTQAEYLRCCASKDHSARHRRVRRKIYNGLRDCPFNVNILPFCDFFHIGSSRELLTGYSLLSRTAREYGFRNSSAAVAAHTDDSGEAFVFNSYIKAPLASGRALIEAVHLESGGKMILQGDNILTGVPAECRCELRLSRGVCLVCLPVGNRQWAAIAYGVQDDFKTAFGGEQNCLFLNQPVELWLKRNRIKAAELWREESSQSIWSARLWRIGEINDVVGEALEIASGGGFRGNSRARRHSLAELLPRVNHRRLLAERREIMRKVGLACIGDRLKADDSFPAASICADIRSREDARSVLRQISDLIATSEAHQHLFRARIYKLAAMIYQQWPKTGVAVAREAADEKCCCAAFFREISNSIARAYNPETITAPAAILHDQVVWVTTPVRIDFAGGWSDTPPICTERGGLVLNAAVTLNGLYPIQVMAKLNTCYTIRLTSIDLGERRELKETAEVLDHHDPSDWSALAKAALILSGIVPESPEESLKKRLCVLGGGLDLTIFSALPKGSGMGTSSILGAAVLACLDRVLGKVCSLDRLTARTSLLEQRMSTGGGWQDQVGGILPGVKLIRTEPGATQSISLRWSLLEMERNPDLKNRALLYFTGQKRMAKNILQNVVSGYLARDPEILQTIDALKVCALDAKEALDAKDIEAFSTCINRYWQLKKRIDPGSTNAPIEKLLGLVKNECSAALLPGAGGGGFIFIIAKNAAAAQRIRNKFTKHPPNKEARFFDFDIDHQGLKVTVL